MKKIIVLSIAISSLVLFNANAQENSWGPMVGINGSTVIDFVGTNTFKPGVNLGLFYNHSKKERSGIRLELLYSQMGSSFAGTDSQVNLHYIQLPLYGVWYLNDRGNTFRPKLMFGPYVAALVDGSGGINDNSLYTKPNFSGADLGLKGAFGFNYNLNDRMWLNTELYFGQGIVDVLKDLNYKMFNQSYGLNVGLSFPIN